MFGDLLFAMGAFMKLRHRGLVRTFLNSFNEAEVSSRPVCCRESVPVPKMSLLRGFCHTRHQMDTRCWASCGCDTSSQATCLRLRIADRRGKRAEEPTNKSSDTGLRPPANGRVTSGCSSLVPTGGRPRTWYTQAPTKHDCAW